MIPLLALIKKDFKGYFASPLGYVAIALFLFITGFAFTANLTQVSPQHLPEASLRGMVYFMAVILLFISPFLTMRIFAEEKKSGTMELLKTAPVSDAQLVLGKYLGALLFLFVLLLSTIEFPIILMQVGDPDLGPLVLSYLGLFLVGASFIAVGIFTSSLGRSQMMAAIIAFILLLTLWFLADVGGEIGEKLSMISHLQGYTLGVFDLADTLYYFFFIFIFLFLTVRKLESERWQ
ncbi:MAG: ABC transporter permease subunit [Deltaproteobacteria bacterium]|nr:ABC transporter permease subunit [Deltaproteobacteria bacterium]